MSFGLFVFCVMCTRVREIRDGEDERERDGRVSDRRDSCEILFGFI